MYTTIVVAIPLYFLETIMNHTVVLFKRILISLTPRTIESIQRYAVLRPVAQLSPILNLIQSSFQGDANVEGIIAGIFSTHPVVNSVTILQNVLTVVENEQRTAYCGRYLYLLKQLSTGRLSRLPNALSQLTGSQFFTTRAVILEHHRELSDYSFELTNKIFDILCTSEIIELTDHLDFDQDFYHGRTT